MKEWVRRNVGLALSSIGAGILATGRWLATNSDSLIFLAGLAAIARGCWLERESTGYIVPGVIVCGLMAYTRLRRE